MLTLAGPRGASEEPADQGDGQAAWTPGARRSRLGFAGNPWRAVLRIILALSLLCLVLTIASDATEIGKACGILVGSICATIAVAGLAASHRP